MESFDRLRERADEIRDLLGLLGSSRTRFLIVARLAQGECSVSDLSQAVGMEQSSVSQHLRRLRSAGLVRPRRSHRRVYYSLADDRVGALMSALDLLLADGDEEFIAALRAGRRKM
ncbi:metalloregulator ArsR/SmtB family transcription factor [Arenibaculum sp.]|jgi:DNA-binding transcriptional ArsR family regulator|uniref:ArsR/SmtB family transcription factor n=1 Tax=Arenibaculum sp. TaxID=2865862 RepID=UPI002E1065EE|nr:metalloregulator ArsR/SmtB family transcription factor [Arenibaculum sp.]